MQGGRGREECGMAWRMEERWDQASRSWVNQGVAITPSLIGVLWRVLSSGMIESDQHFQKIMLLHEKWNVE